MSYQNDLKVVRDLAKRYMEVAQSDRYVKMRQRYRDTNNLKVVRPPVNVEELPWAQMNIEHSLDCVCEDAGLRGFEYNMRFQLMRDKYFKCDNYIEPVWAVGKSFSSTGNGLGVREKTIEMKNVPIKSHAYIDVLEDESAMDSFHLAEITAYPENDVKNVAYCEEVLDGIIPVVLRGHGIYYAPWDTISTLRGVEPILVDMYERPEYLHRIIKAFTDSMSHEMDQMEALGLYDPNLMALHSTPSAVDVPNPSTDGVYRCRDIWFRTMAQMFSTISPDAHYEFDVQYSAPLAARCAYTYYGCCEPLSDRLDMLKKAYPNLRKIGTSPWSDVWRTAEETHGEYVVSKKPNPANVQSVVDPEVVRKEITETVEACLKYNCPCDITLKDISTVGERPENIIEWTKTVSDVLDVYYGKE